VHRLTIDRDDATHIRSLADSIATRYDSVEDPEFLRMAPVYAQELPRVLRAGVNEFRTAEAESVLVVSGFEIDDDRIGPTPDHWAHRPDRSAVAAEEIAFFLCACLLGDPVGWATQQDGRIMHDVFPIKGHRKEQMGSGSEELLTWHTEDAFHPMRADYIGLMCLRNPDGVTTNFAAVTDLELAEDVRRVLSEPRFPIRPDRSHLPESTGNTRELPEDARALLQRSYEWIDALDRDPDKVAVLFGDTAEPYLRLDPYFMDRLDERTDREAHAALAAMVAEIDRVITGYVLRQGEFLFLDNYRSVHGRQPFKARFDGTDRWLKRLNIARDLRKSRERRLSALSRIIH
jgi:enduracididine beta-hydroxylase